MRTAFPLSLKVSLWLLLNLLLLLTLGGAALVLGDGPGWSALIRGVAGERFQAAANLAVGGLTEVSATQISAALARLPAPGAVQLALVDDLSGEVRGGAALALPDAVTARLAPRGAEPPPPPPELDQPPIPRPEAPGALLDLARGRHLLHLDGAGGWWFIFRLPPPERGGPPGRLSLVGHAPNLVAVLRMLDLKPWLLIGGTAIVVSILFWLPFVHRLTRSLGRLTAATGRIATGDFSIRVPANRHDELGQLGESVNTMAARLDLLVSGQKKFLADVAHELGSPLARLQVALEILDTRLAPELRDSLADVREETGQLTALVNELLAFTRAGLRARGVAIGPVNLAELCAAVLVQEAAAALVVCAVPSGLTVRADPSLLRRALANLVRNALRHAGPDAIIRLTAEPRGTEVILSIDDDGPGVSPDALPRLGEPFFRPESARTRETGGVGLGLSIVCASVQACGGAVRFANRTPHGFHAEITLPAA